ncbi:MAG: NERD domain-containing protein [Bacillota bacterium]
MHAWYDSWLVWSLTAAAALVTLAALSLALWLRITAVQRGVTRTLRNVADRLVRDVIIPDGVGGYVPVDALMLRDRKLYVLDIRDVEGAVFASEKMDVWTAMGRRRRYQFNNPIRPMHDRVAAVKYLVPDADVISRILFTSRGHFPKGRPDGVQLLEEFAQPLLRLKQKEAGTISEESRALWDKICEAANVPPGKERPAPIR